MLVYEGEGTRIELPPTERGYELFQQLVDNLIHRRQQINAEKLAAQQDQHTKS